MDTADPCDMSNFIWLKINRDLNILFLVNFDTFG